MAVSFGVRISGLLVAGALAVATAAACGGGGDGDDTSGSGGGGTSAAGGVADGGAADGGQGDGGSGGGSDGGTPTWKPPDGNSDGGSGGSGGANGTGGSGSSGGSGGSGSAGSGSGSTGNGSSAGNGSGSGSGSGGKASGGSGGGGIKGPAWLPWGPHSPNTENSPDPASVYDRLGEKPSTCAEVAADVKEETAPEWRVLHGLAEACAAVQGQSGSWDEAAADYAGTQGQLASCKGLSAYAVLGDLLEFHRLHPSETVQLKGASDGGGGDACEFRIVSVDVGDDRKAKPKETIRIELRGVYFDKVEVGQLAITVAGQQAFLSNDEQPTPEPGDRLFVDVEVPELEAGSYPKVADVTVTYGTSDTLPKAFTLVAADVAGSPSSATSPVTP